MLNAGKMPVIFFWRSRTHLVNTVSNNCMKKILEMYKYYIGIITCENFFFLIKILGI